MKDFINLCSHGQCRKTLCKVLLLLLLQLQCCDPQKRRGKRELRFCLGFVSGGTQRKNAVLPVNRVHTHTQAVPQKETNTETSVHAHGDKKGKVREGGEVEEKRSDSQAHSSPTRQSKKGERMAKKQKKAETVKKRHQGHEKDSIRWHTEFSTQSQKTQAKDIHQMCVCSFIFLPFNGGHFT